MAKQLKVGDRVAYTRNALMTLGSTFCKLRGEVLEIVAHSHGFVLATIKWDGLTEARTVNVGNLCRPRSLAFVECTPAARGLDL